MFTITVFMIGHERKGNFAEFSGRNFQKNQLILQNSCRNFQGKLCQKTVGRKTPMLWEFSGQISQEMD